MYSHAVLEVVWDAGGARKGVVKGGASWDGAKRNTTVDQLIGHSADQLGTQGKHTRHSKSHL